MTTTRRGPAGLTLLPFLLALALALPAPATAQDAACSYQACALRIEHRLLGSRVVQGGEGAVVAGLGFLPPRLDVLAAAADSIRLPYEAYRRAGRTAAGWRLAAMTAVVAGTVLSITSDANQDAAFAIGVAGFGLGFASGIYEARSREHLSVAIWRYNATLRR